MRVVFADRVRRASRPEPAHAGAGVTLRALSGRGQPGRGAHDQRARQSNRAGDAVAFEAREEPVRRFATEFLEIHVDAGERRSRLFGHDLPVVEADDGDVVRYRPAMLAQTVEDTAGDDVASAEDGVEVAITRQQRLDGVVPPAFGPLTTQDAPLRLVDPVLGEGRDDPLATQLHRLALGWTGHVREATTAELEEMLGREARPLGVVGGEAEGIRFGHAGERVDDGSSRASDAHRWSWVRAAAHDDDAVDLFGQEGGDYLPLAFRIVADGAEKDEDLGRSERVLDPRDDRHVEAAEVIG